MGIIPMFVPTWITTVEICVAMGGLLMAALMLRKKKAAKKYEEKQDNNKDEIQP